MLNPYTNTYKYDMKDLNFSSALDGLDIWLANKFDGLFGFTNTFKNYIPPEQSNDVIKNWEFIMSYKYTTKPMKYQIRKPNDGCYSISDNPISEKMLMHAMGKFVNVGNTSALFSNNDKVTDLFTKGLLRNKLDI
jgi:hypothetical protein